MYKTLIGSEYAKILAEEINKARKNIDIIMYDWRFYPDNPTHPISIINQSLIRAASRGVVVRAVVNYEPIIQYLLPHKIKAKALKSSRILHSKIVMIDDDILFIGSHNLTRNAVTTNLESSICLAINKEDRRLQEYFNNLFDTN